MAVKIAAHDVKRFAIHVGRIGVDGSEIARFIGMARLGHRLWGGLGSPGGRARSAGRRNQPGQHLLAMRTMVIGSYTVVRGPRGPQSVRHGDGADMRAGATLAIWQRERFRPAVAIEMADPVFTVAPVGILGVGAQTNLRRDPHRTTAVREYVRLIGVDALERRSHRLQRRSPLPVLVATDARFAECAQRHTGLAATDLVALILPPVGPPALTASPNAAGGIDREGRARLDCVRGRNRDFVDLRPKNAV